MNTIQNTTVAASIIECRQYAQRQQNLELIDHVARHEPCSFEALMNLFGEAPGDGAARLRFQKRLSYLVSRGNLRPINHGGQRHWCVPQLATSAETGAPPADEWVGIVAPSSQIDVMHCGDYVPEPGPVTRSGALDFKRIASVGYQC